MVHAQPTQTHFLELSAEPAATGEPGEKVTADNYSCQQWISWSLHTPRTYTSPTSHLDPAVTQTLPFLSTEPCSFARPPYYSVFSVSEPHGPLLGRPPQLSTPVRFPADALPVILPDAGCSPDTWGDPEGSEKGGSEQSSGGSRPGPAGCTKFSSRSDRRRSQPHIILLFPPFLLNQQPHTC